MASFQHVVACADYAVFVQDVCSRRTNVCSRLRVFVQDRGNDTKTMEMEICVINKNVEMEMDSIFSDRVLELLIQDYFSCERVEIKIIELLSK